MGANSVLFGANWLFSSAYMETKGFSNSYLTPTLIEEYVSGVNGTLLHVKKYTIRDDLNYDAVLVYAFKL